MVSEVRRQKTENKEPKRKLAMMKGYTNITLEKKLVDLQKQIDNYTPPTPWEAANDRMLKCMILNRNALEKAIERKRIREKPNEKNQRNKDWNQCVNIPCGEEDRS